jgi:4-amino-4-deoxy-L-arabinose transferase-like glycosyltransferase
MEQGRMKHPEESPLTRMAVWGFLALATLPFIGKAFHIDDPMFIWAAEQIIREPHNFYGFMVNWYGSPMPMSQVMQNPPLVPYLIALILLISRRSELVLHIFFLIPAFGVALGTYLLARKWTRHPALATLFMIATPVFVVSSSNIMCDMWMLFFWVWSILFWWLGMENQRQLWLLLAALLVSTALLTKYYAVALIPMLFVTSWLRQKSIGGWIVFLIIPLAVLVGYNEFTGNLYGRGLFTAAIDYSGDFRMNIGHSSWLRIIVGIVFAGGCLLTPAILFFTSRRWLLANLVLSFSLAFLLIVLQRTAGVELGNYGFLKSNLLVQMALNLVIGLNLAGVLIDDIVEERDPVAALLFLWATGTLFFIFFLNWTINGRTILPLVPVCAILLVRHLERLHRQGKMAFNLERGALSFAVLIFTFSWCVAWADFSWANTTRAAAGVINEVYGRANTKIRFQGHWGFQYYMEALNAEPLDFGRKIRVDFRDVFVVPEVNTNSYKMPAPLFRKQTSITFTPNAYISTMNPAAGGGFYFSGRSPLPYSIGFVPGERYDIYQINARLPR